MILSFVAWGPQSGFNRHSMVTLKKCSSWFGCEKKKFAANGVHRSQGHKNSAVETIKTTLERSKKITFPTKSQSCRSIEDSHTNAPMNAPIHSHAVTFTHTYTHTHTHTHTQTHPIHSFINKNSHTRSKINTNTQS